MTIAGPTVHEQLEELASRMTELTSTPTDTITRDSVVSTARDVAELTAALDQAVAPELCANLAALDQFVTDRLGEANTTMALAPLDDAAKLMEEIGAAFREAHR